jgi:dihydroorotase
LKQKSVLHAEDHPVIRDETACFESSLAAIQFAKKHNSRLHILHISTEKELSLFSNLLPLQEKRITAEVCVHHLHFTSNDYALLGNQIKCNPAIKVPSNRDALWKALLDDRLDVIATDHAPHTWEEKNVAYEQAHAGLPLVQHSVLLMLEYVQKGYLSIAQVAEKMSHAVATCFNVYNRGFIREGYYADLFIADLNATTATNQQILYKCGWSPFAGHTFPARITHTFVNGHLLYENGKWEESQKGKRLQFERS